MERIAVANDFRYCIEHGISIETMHLLNLQLFGVFVAGVESPIEMDNTWVYKEVLLDVPANTCSGVIVPIPRKIPVVSQLTQTPYSYEKNAIYYRNEPVLLDVSEVSDNESIPSYGKGYRLPFLNTPTP